MFIRLFKNLSFLQRFEKSADSRYNRDDDTKLDGRFYVFPRLFDEDFRRASAVRMSTKCVPRQAFRQRDDVPTGGLRVPASGSREAVRDDAVDDEAGSGGEDGLDVREEACELGGADDGARVKAVVVHGVRREVRKQL